VEYPQLGIRIVAQPATESVRKADRFVISPVDSICVRSRKAGDKITLSGGTKSLKALFVDRKIPQGERNRIPVLASGDQVLGIWGIGGNFRHMTEELPGIEIRFEKIERT
jgi:tRNA(Ile)-lysidine synthetase-like protein